LSHFITEFPLVSRESQALFFCASFFAALLSLSSLNFSVANRSGNIRSFQIPEKNMVDLFRSTDSESGAVSAETPVTAAPYWLANLLPALDRRLQGNRAVAANR
jgi:hypothetical protein